MNNGISIPIELVNLEDGYHLMVNAWVNNKEVRLLIDTGASLTCFDSERILMIPEIEEEDIEIIDKSGTGLGTNTMESAKAILGEFCFEDLCFEEYPVVVINMSHVNESYENLGLEPIDGVIGSEFLLKTKAEISYEHMTLNLSL